MCGGRGGIASYLKFPSEVNWVPQFCFSEYCSRQGHNIQIHKMMSGEKNDCILKVENNRPHSLHTQVYILHYIKRKENPHI